MYRTEYANRRLHAAVDARFYMVPSKIKGLLPCKMRMRCCSLIFYICTLVALLVACPYIHVDARVQLQIMATGGASPRQLMSDRGRCGPDVPTVGSLSSTSCVVQRGVLRRTLSTNKSAVYT